MSDRQKGRRIGTRASGVKRLSRGFSLLELVVVIVVISFLIVIAISRLLALQVDAERVAMDTVVGTLRSAIGLKVAERLVKQDMHGIKALKGSNPMDRLAELPKNYLGEVDHVAPSALREGNWYYDVPSKMLVYLVRNKSYFSGGLADPARARFAIRLVYTDRNNNGRYDDRVDKLEGIRFSAVEPYRWTNWE